MKNRRAFALCLATLAAAALSTEASAVARSTQTGKFGVGIGHAYGDGLSFKYNQSRDFALQGLVGAQNSVGGDAIWLAVDALFPQSDNLLNTNDVDLRWYFGVGPGLGFFDSSVADNVFFAAHGIAGMALGFDAVPLELALEYRPNMVIIPSVDIDIVDFGAHLRFFFK